MFWNVLPAQLLRRPNNVWGRMDGSNPGDGSGYEGLLAALLILVVFGLLATLWVLAQKWLLSRSAETPDGYEEFEELDHATEWGVKLLLVASQIAAPLGAVGSFVLGAGYELAGFGLPMVVLIFSLATYAGGILAWILIARMRERLTAWRTGMAYSGGD